MEIIIRDANNQDAEAVKNLIFGVLREYGLQPDPCGTDVDLEDIAANYTNRGGVFEILETTNGELLGTAALYPMNDETVELRKMYFAKQLRGRGIGKTTLEQMIARAKNLGFKRIYLETNSVLREAFGLYQKYGFTETSEKHSPRCNQAFILELNNERTAG